MVARRAPAALGGPDPRRVSVAEVERHALPGWLADSEPLGEWTLRAGGGFTGRANSCHAVGDPGRPVAAAAERIVAYAVRHGIAPMAMVVVGSAEEEALRALGWVDTYVPTQVLAARLADVLGERPAPEDVRCRRVPGPTRGWRRTAGAGRCRPTGRWCAGSWATTHPGRSPRWRAMRAPVAIGRGHVSGPWLGVAAVWVDPEHRRGGRATAIMTALGHWAARQGCRYAYVQVDREERQGRSPRTSGSASSIHHGYLYLAAALVDREVRSQTAIATLSSEESQVVSPSRRSGPGRSGRSARRSSPA